MPGLYPEALCPTSGQPRPVLLITNDGGNALLSLSDGLTTLYIDGVQLEVSEPLRLDQRFTLISSELDLRQCLLSGRWPGELASFARPHVCPRRRWRCASEGRNELSTAAVVHPEHRAQ